MHAKPSKSLCIAFYFLNNFARRAFFVCIFASKFNRKSACWFRQQNTSKKHKATMKVKVTKAQIEKILSDPEQARKVGIEISDPWWVIVLKTVAYLIGLLLAGMGTAQAADLSGLTAMLIG